MSEEFNSKIYISCRKECFCIPKKPVHKCSQQLYSQPKRKPLRHLPTIKTIHCSMFIQWNTTQPGRKAQTMIACATWINHINILSSYRSRTHKNTHGIRPFIRNWGTSPVVQWLRLRLPMQGAWVQSLVREWDPTCMPQLRVRMPQLRSPCAATKTWCNQINK